MLRLQFELQPGAKSLLALPNTSKARLVKALVKALGRCVAVCELGDIVIESSNSILLAGHDRSTFLALQACVEVALGVHVRFLQSHYVLSNVAEV
jgi:hypothetical protein